MSVMDKYLNKYNELKASGWSEEDARASIDGMVRNDNKARKAKKKQPDDSNTGTFEFVKVEKPKQALNPIEKIDCGNHDVGQVTILIEAAKSKPIHPIGTIRLSPEEKDHVLGRLIKGEKRMKLMKEFRMSYGQIYSLVNDFNYFGITPTEQHRNKLVSYGHLKSRGLLQKEVPASFGYPLSIKKALEWQQLVRDEGKLNTKVYGAD